MQKEVKKALRTNKREHIDALATKAEEAANRGEQEKLYKIPQAVSDRNSKPTCQGQKKKVAVIRERDGRKMDRAF